MVRSIMIGKKIDEIQVGDTAEFTKPISESDVYLYAGVTGDLNPAHGDQDHFTIFRNAQPLAGNDTVLAIPAGMGFKST